MKCSKIQRLLFSTDPTDLADPIRDHLGRCPECARQHDQVLRLRNLVALKRYESPGPESVDRCIAQVRRQIAWIRWNTEQQEIDEGPSIGVPWVRIGFAAAFILFLGMHGGTVNPSPAVHSSAITQADLSAPDFGTWIRSRPRMPRSIAVQPESDFQIVPTLDDSSSWSNQVMRHGPGPRVQFAIE